MKKIISFILVCLLAFSPITTNISPFVITSQASAIKLNKKSATLEIGSCVQLKIVGSKKKAKWSTTNKDIATVTSKGKVKAQSVGKCFIKAKVGKTTYKCKITVIETEDLMHVSSNMLEMELGHSDAITVTLENDGLVCANLISEPASNALHYFWGNTNGSESILYLYPTALGQYKIIITNNVNKEAEFITLNVNKKAYCGSFDVSTLTLNVKTWDNTPTALYVYVDENYADGIKIYSDGIAKEPRADLSKEFGDAAYHVTLNAGTQLALSTATGSGTWMVLPINITGTAAGEALLRVSNSKNDEYIDVLISITE